MAILNINSASFTSILSGGFTFDQACTFLVDRFAVGCGWGNPIATNLAATRTYVFQLAFNPSKANGTVRPVLQLSISSTTITARLLLFTSANYNTGTFTGTANTGANGTTGATFTFSTTTSLITYALPTTNELTGVVLVSSPNTFLGVLGVLYPQTKESWYDEDTYCFAMLNAHNGNNGWIPFPNFIGTTGTNQLGYRIGLDTFSGRNPVNNFVQVVKAPLLTCLNITNATSFGIIGRCSNDFGVANNTGLLTNDLAVVALGVEEWWNCMTPSAGNGYVFRSV